MPTYQYQCDACDYAFEVFQNMTDKKLRKCPECKKFKLIRLIGTGTGIIFKGNGFYETDYKKKDKPKSDEKPSADTQVKSTEKESSSTPKDQS